MGHVVERRQRSIGLFPASNLVVANMIGAGIFTTSGLLMSGLHNPVWLIILWAAGGIIALSGAMAYAELGAAMPRAGGEYAFLTRLFHPVVGFLSGWVSFVVGFSAPIAASAIGFSEYFYRALPEVPGNKRMLAILVILAFTLVHLRGLRFGTKVQNILTLIKVGLIAVLILAGLWLGKGSFHHFGEGTPLAWNFGTLKVAGLSLMWIMFAYSGWNASTYIGSEILDPVRNIPRSLLLGTGVVMILYVLMNMVYVFGIPPDEMADVISIGGLAVRNLFGPSWEVAFSLIFAFALFSSLSAFIILGPRVYYAMASDGYFFKFVARLHPRFQVPSGAILLQAAIAIVMVLSGTFDQILTYMGFSLGVFPLLAVAGVFKLRRTLQPGPMLRGYPFYLFIYLFFGLAILVLSFLERPLESVIALLTIATGIPVFYYFKSRK